MFAGVRTDDDSKQIEGAHAPEMSALSILSALEFAILLQTKRLAGTTSISMAQPLKGGFMPLHAVRRDCNPRKLCHAHCSRINTAEDIS
jgi:hypothetical protein